MSLHDQVLIKAASILGGKARLRDRLRVSMHQLDRWLSGEERPPNYVFLSAVDIISAQEDTARSRLIIAAPGALLPATAKRRNGFFAADFLATEFAAQDAREMLESALSAALDETGAPRGNVQIATPEGLRIVAQTGFEQPFLDFFAIVTPDTPAACSEAHRHARSVIVEDARTDPIFAGTAAAGIMVEAKAIACQSTPFLDDEGEVIGMLSTHYEFPHRASPPELEALDAICRRVSRCLEKEAL
ncbi:MAG TPA: GAF domain-containing protein [Burkholderiales bacterium]|jgi:hypothetical protein|nr:GAF domain-containing protein [Burkholderiales bacterium]HEX2649426.1 GAF domain-containing protein [Burkholderiales bacterium]